MKKTILLALFLIGFNLSAQNVIFPIDDVTTTIVGSTLTETIVQNGKTYVLTATNTSNIDVQLLEYDDIFQFRGVPNSVSEASWIISITEDGIPLNFNFGSVQYLTVGAGVYNITNDLGSSIVNSTNLFMGGSRGILVPDNTSNSESINSFSINSTQSFTDGALSDIAFYNIEINPITLSLDENELDDFIIYPNPVSNYLFISSGNIEDKKVSILDLNGRSLKTVITRDMVDVSDLKSGIYFCKIKTKNNSFVKKIVIK